MKKQLSKLLFGLLLVVFNAAYAQLPKLEKPDDPSARLRHELDMIKDPVTGDVPLNDLIKARQNVKTKFANGTYGAIGGVSWFERGPNNIGGRTRALMFDPNDVTNKRVWAGGVAGGLWYNNDITTTGSGWTKINDFWDNLAISWITHSPANTNIFYASTGEGWFNSDAVQGGGIWKTTDGGTTWNVLGSTVPSFGTSPSTIQAAFQTVQKVVVSPAGKVFAATHYGVWESADGGTTWTISKTINATIGAGENFCSDLEYVNGILYAAFGRGSGTSIHKSADNGVTWTNITPPGVTGGRTEIAIGTSIIYAVSDKNFSTISYFKKSGNGGVTWVDVAIPSAGGVLSVDVTGGIAWYALILTVHPTNDNQVWIGGASHARTVDGGATWYCHLYDNPVHPDHHNLVHRPGNPNEVVMANDGGVYYSTNFGDATVTASPNAFSFQAQNTNYNVMQPYAVAMKNIANDGYILQGNQDNGTTVMTGTNNIIGGAFQSVGGDGMLCFIDQNEPNIIIGSQQNRRHFTVNPTTNIGHVYIGSPSDTDGQFLNPCDYDGVNNIFYANSKGRNAPGSSYTFLRFDIVAYNSGRGSYVNVQTNVPNMNVSFIKASPYNVHTMYFGSTAGHFWKVTGMNTATPVATLLVQNPGTVSCIEIGASDSELILTHSNYNVTSVWYSSDGGATWIDKDDPMHGLPNIPVRYALFNPNDRRQVMLATELGVWSTTNIAAANPNWQPTNSQLANVRCDMLRFRSADNTVAVATHGRGIFTTRLIPCQTDLVRVGAETVSQTLLSETFIKANTGNFIGNGVNKVYSAKNYVLLEPNFEATAGSTFLAQIGGCENVAIPGLVAYYPFNGNANDETGNGFNGTINGATLTADKFGVAQKALNFAGIASVRIPNLYNAVSQPLENVTYSLWFKPNQNYGAADFYSLIIRTTDAGFTDMIGKPDLSSVENNKFQFYMFDNVANVGRITKATTINFTANQWVHVVATRANGIMKIYLNAVKEGETAYTNAGYFYPDLYLGGHSTFNRWYFNGAMDDFRIYNRALSDAEVTAIYNAERL